MFLEREGAPLFVAENYCICLSMDACMQIYAYVPKLQKKWFNFQKSGANFGSVQRVNSEPSYTESRGVANTPWARDNLISPLQKSLLESTHLNSNICNSLSGF